MNRKVLILDDEASIRTGLKKIIDWEYYGFEICAEAGSVREGLSLLREHRPDLVMLDMKMPGASGVEFARDARESGWKGKIIILSGYDDFEYARQSMRYGAVAYLLKPVSTDKLIEALQTVQKQLSESSYSSFLADQSVSNMQANILYGLLTGHYRYDSSVADTYGIDLSGTCFQLVHILNGTAESSPYWQNVSKHLGSYLIPESDGAFLLLKGKKAVFSIRTVDQRQGETYLFSPVFPSISLLPENYRACKDAASRLFFLKKDSSRIYLENCDSQLPPDDWEAAQFADAAAGLVSAGATERIVQEVERAETALSSRYEDQGAVTRVLVTAYWQLHHTLTNHAPELREYIPSTEEFMGFTAQSGSLHEIMAHLQKALLDASSFLNSISHDNIVEKVKHYLDENYWKANLKLEGVSTLFGYNSAYLGKLFTKEAGISFNGYLDHVRLEHAKELLQTQKKVFEIAEECGFSNVEYFTRKFKKQFGVIPTEYRKSLGSGG